MVHVYFDVLCFLRIQENGRFTLERRYFALLNVGLMVNVYFDILRPLRIQKNGKFLVSKEQIFRLAQCWVNGRCVLRCLTLIKNRRK